MVSAPAYEPARIAVLGDWLREATSDHWQYVREFLNEYWNELPNARPVLLRDEPQPTGDERWDVFLAALAEHLATKAGDDAPDWTHQRTLRTFWFPFNTPAARADALVRAPAAFRKHGVFVPYYELEVA